MYPRTQFCIRLHSRGWIALAALHECNIIYSTGTYSMYSTRCRKYK